MQLRLNDLCIHPINRFKFYNLSRAKLLEDLVGCGVKHVKGQSLAVI